MLRTLQMGKLVRECNYSERRERKIFELFRGQTWQEDVVPSAVQKAGEGTAKKVT